MNFIEFHCKMARHHEILDFNAHSIYRTGQAGHHYKNEPLPERSGLYKYNNSASINDHRCSWFVDNIFSRFAHTSLRRKFGIYLVSYWTIILELCKSSLFSLPMTRFFDRLERIVLIKIALCLYERMYFHYTCSWSPIGSGKLL